MDVKKSNRCVNSFKDNSSSEKGKNRDKFRFNKKGQVTIFIILGIVILFTVSAILYISYKTTTKDFETGEVKTVATVPVVFEPVQSYVENCLHQVAKQGLVILGGQGGYIYPNLLGEFSEKDPTNSEGININPTLVPYWHFNSAPNSVDSITCASNKPKLYDDGELGSEMSVEAQLGRYVKEKIGACLGDYSGFKEQGFEIDEENSIEVVVKVAEKGVIFKLKKSLEVTLGDTIDELDSFYVNIPLKLKHYYELAEEITKKQKSHNYLENHIMNAVVSYSSLDTKKLPPTTMVTFDMINSRFWPLDDVENRLKSILNSYLPMLQVLSAHNIYYFEYPVVGLNKMHQKNYDNMILPIDGAQDVEVRFDYFGWEPFIDVNDVDGVVKPEDSFFEGFNLVSYGIQRYDTVYDLSYPVVVSIDDPVAFENEGYRFIIALEGNIRGNREAICGQTRLPTINLFEKPLVCERNHKTVGPLKTSVIDSWTSEPIEAVRVGFTVPNQDECYMGSTDENGIVNQNYPAVYGGLMNFISLDYLTNYYSIDTYPIKGKESIIG